MSDFAHQYHHDIHQDLLWTVVNMAASFSKNNQVTLLVLSPRKLVDAVIADGFYTSKNEHGHMITNNSR